MTYRDELEAAYARIHALEQQLAQSTGPRDSGADTLEALREELANAKARLAAMDAASASVAQERTMWTLYEHNLRAPPFEPGRNCEPAGVLCPRCFEREGAQIEMLRSDSRVIASEIDERTEVATCPRCLFYGRMRTKL